MAVIAPFRAALPDLSGIYSSDSFFSTVKREFPAFLEEGIYNEKNTPGFYIYRVTTLKRSYTGLLACASVEDYIQGRIKKHENTLAAKEEKMMHLFRERTALIKPLLFAYPNVLEIDALINRLTISSPPAYTYNYLHERHNFWEVTEEIHVQSLTALFAQHVPSCYIADGHHRARTAERLYHQAKAENPNHRGDEPYNYMMAAFFPASEIEIHNFNRTLLSLKGLTHEEFLQKLSAVYTVRPTASAYQPITKYQMGMYINRQWYELQLRPEFRTDNLSTKERLDVYIFNQKVLHDILGIQDVTTESEVKYVEGPKGTLAMEKKVNTHKAMAGFTLYPVALEDLIQISEENATMPPKSTWIEPRMRNGIIVQMY